MARKDVIKTIGIGVLLVFTGIMIAIMIRSSGGNTVLAADQPVANNAPEAPESPDGSIYHVCIPLHVAIYDNRIHVKCTAPSQPEDGVNIEYFVVSTADSRKAARVLSLMLTAKAAGQTLGINYYLEDTSGSEIFCLVSNCRLIAWINMH